MISQYFFGPILFILSFFMILLILVQRGRGGGLVGALGGPGGQSAFGTKAGDLFTRITVITAGIWIFLLAVAVWWYTEKKTGSILPANVSSVSAPATSGTTSSGTMADPSQTPPAPDAAKDSSAAPSTTVPETVPATKNSDGTSEAAAADKNASGKDEPKPTAPEGTKAEVDSLDLPKTSEAKEASAEPAGEPKTDVPSPTTPESPASPDVASDSKAPAADKDK
jgi:preprotein translocase subunit SecG